MKKNQQVAHLILHLYPKVQCTLYCHYEQVKKKVERIKGLINSELFIYKLWAFFTLEPMRLCLAKLNCIILEY